MHHRPTPSASSHSLEPCPRTDELNTPNGEQSSKEVLLPAELLDHIVYEAWSLPLSRDERIDLATALPLVSHTLLAIFTRISLRDVHITTPRFAQHYLKLVRPRSSFEPDSSPLTAPARQAAHRLCRSLTFHIAARALPGAAPAIRLYADGDRSAEAVSATLHVLALVPTVFAPRLRTVALVYTDWGFDDVLDQCRLLPLPPQVAALELRYTFSSAKLRAVADRVRALYNAAPRWASMRWGMGQVRRLAVSGAPAGFVSAIVEMCAGLRTLEVDKYVEEDRRWEVPSGLQTLVLADPLPPVETHAIDWWHLASLVGGNTPSTVIAVEDIMPTASWRHVVGRQRLRRICERNNIELVCASTTTAMMA